MGKLNHLYHISMLGETKVSLDDDTNSCINNILSRAAVYCGISRRQLAAGIAAAYRDNANLCVYNYYSNIGKLESNLYRLIAQGHITGPDMQEMLVDLDRIEETVSKSEAPVGFGYQPYNYRPNNQPRVDIPRNDASIMKSARAVFIDMLYNHGYIED